MTTIEETREIVRALVDDPHTSVDDVMIAADAYGAAQELKGHGDVCDKWTLGGTPKRRQDCGDGPDSPPSVGTGAGRGRSWLCDVAKEIEELR